MQTALHLLKLAAVVVNRVVDEVNLQQLREVEILEVGDVDEGDATSVAIL